MFETTADNQPSAEPATPAAETAPDTSVNLTEGQAPELDIQQPDPDELEEELEGVKLKGKKEALERVKAERLMHQDYTRKTMSHAEDRKALESERESFKQTTKVHQQFQQEAAQMYAVDARIQQLQQVNLQALSQQDPQRAQALLIEFNQLQAQRGQLHGSLTQKQQQMQQAEQQETAKLARDAQTFLMREFKDWSPAKDVELETYARSLGIDSRQASDFMLRNPAFALALDKAAKWDASLKQRAAQPSKEPAPKPVTRVGGGGATTTKKLSDMTPAETAKWRRERNAR